MTSQEILNNFIDFYKKRGHMQIPNVSLVPEGDSTLLFVNSGMFPLVPYLSGQSHPLGKRLVNVQRAGRFQEDLAEVGDARHTTAFHMLGNWSLGDYFKKEQLPWAYEFLVEVLGLPANKLYATVFAGDDAAPKDDESIKIIQEIFKKYVVDAQEGKRIFPCDRSKNWWQRGDAVGELGGPDSEVYFYLGEGSPEGKNPATHEDEFLEIGNSVFMQYVKTDSSWENLPQKNVDFGGGLERMALAAQGKKDIFETDNFWPLVQKIEGLSGKKYGGSSEVKKNMRILSDHVRASTFLAMDGVLPSNKDQGYMLRRLLRRMVRAGRVLGVESGLSEELVPVVAGMMAWLYPDLPSQVPAIQQTFNIEEEKFAGVLKRGESELAKMKIEKLSTGELAKKAFDMYQSMGFPAEIFLDEVKDLNVSVHDDTKVDDVAFTKAFDKIFNDHQEISRAGIEKKFKGGLADNSETVTRYHTATHLLQKALREVLGDTVVQMGSNLTAERLRFDFPHPAKLTDEQIAQVEKVVNGAIDTKMPVNFVMLPKEEAIKTGALYMKHETYPDSVKVYYIGESLEKAFSKEFCGGPHVTNTSEIPHMKLFKQESIGGGKQRIYARFI